MMKKAKKLWYIRRGKTEGYDTEKKGKKNTRGEEKRRITSLGHVRRGLLLGSMIVS